MMMMMMRIRMMTMIMRRFDGDDDKGGEYDNKEEGGSLVARFAGFIPNRILIQIIFHYSYYDILIVSRLSGR